MASRKSLLITSLIINLLFSSLGGAEEVDDFTPTGIQPRDAAPVIDQATNVLLDELIALLNSKVPNCDDPLKYELAIKKLDQNFTAIGNGLRAGSEIRELLQKIDADPDSKNHYRKRLHELENVWLAEFPVEKRAWFSKLFSSIEFFGERQIDNSIYKGLNFPTCCTSRININSLYIGIDKVDHFFGNGGLLFEQFLKTTPSDLPVAKKLTQVMEMNVRQEHSLWGLKGLSPKSYGDLASNWQGVKFYRRLFDVAPTYLLCKEGVFRKNPQVDFHIADYADELWNESFNCSSFISNSDYTQFKDNLKEKGLNCPRNRYTCDRLVKKHSNDPLFIKYAVNPLCSRSQKDFTPVENPEIVTWEEVGLSLRGFTWPIIKDLAYQKGSEFVEKVRLRVSSKQKKKKTILGEGREVFENLRYCSQPNEGERLHCLKQYTEPDLSFDQLNKFGDLTDHPIAMSSLEACSPESERLESALHPQPIGDLSLCFKTNYKNFDSIGRVYFRRHDDGLKVILLRY